MFMQLIPDWIVTYDELMYYVGPDDLDTFCKILRQNGVTEYHIKQNDVFGGTRNTPVQSESNV